MYKMLKMWVEFVLFVICDQPTNFFWFLDSKYLYLQEKNWHEQQPMFESWEKLLLIWPLKRVKYRKFIWWCESYIGLQTYPLTGTVGLFITDSDFCPSSVVIHSLVDRLLCVEGDTSTFLRRLSDVTAPSGINNGGGPLSRSLSLATDKLSMLDTDAPVPVLFRSTVAMGNGLLSIRFSNNGPGAELMLCMDSEEGLVAMAFVLVLIMVSRRSWMSTLSKGTSWLLQKQQLWMKKEDESAWMTDDYFRVGLFQMEYKSHPSKARHFNSHRSRSQWKDLCNAIFPWNRILHIINNLLHLHHQVWWIYKSKRTNT